MIVKNANWRRKWVQWEQEEERVMKKEMKMSEGMKMSKNLLYLRCSYAIWYNPILFLIAISSSLGSKKSSIFYNQHFK